ncbi:hypothetical protein MMC28_002543 [Mycoblastus sanguinarius]|nr:hypothetical protein [Mycoblastus sanguinarius]
MPKRKTSNDTGSDVKPAAAPRKRLAVTAATSTATKAITKRNALESPLLRFPGEIRDRIFRLVLGDKFIHLLYIGPSGGNVQGRWRHRICVADQSEEEAYREFKNGYKDIPLTESPSHYAAPF